jgi:hypothetical protein
MVNYTLMAYQQVYRRRGNIQAQFRTLLLNMLGYGVGDKNYKMFVQSIYKKTSRSYKKLSGHI